jgi:hypothetical protein
MHTQTGTLSDIVRKQYSRNHLLALITLLCVGVLLQMLGVPVSFVDLDGSDDDFVSILLISSALPPAQLQDTLLRSSRFHPDRPASAYRVLRENMLFHPPLSASIC